MWIQNHDTGEWRWAEHDRTNTLFFGAFIAALLILVVCCISIASARDVGQWEDNDPAIKHWYGTLMQPDNPTMSCCGEADAYWADGVAIEGDKVFAIITDTRPDAPVGTRVEIPPNEITFKYGNPTGHAIVFMGALGSLYCYVLNSGV